MIHFRYKPKTEPQYPTCTDTLNRKLQCRTLKMEDIQRFHDQFYRIPSKIEQDVLILKYTMNVPVRRRRPKNETHIRRRITHDIMFLLYTILTPLN